MTPEELYDRRVPAVEPPAGDERWAEDQEEILRRMQAAQNYNAWLLDRARPHLGPRVLDVGAGTGTFTELLAREGRTIVAAEPQPGFAERLRSRFAGRQDVRVVAEGADALRPEVAGRFDAVVCFNVLEHVQEDGEAVARFHDLLHPGGRLVLLVPAHPVLYGSIDRTVDHKRRYRPRHVRALLESARLEVAEVRLVNPVGALGWFVSGRLLRRRHVPLAPLRAFDRLVPVLRLLDRIRLPLGLSVWAVARRPETAAAPGKPPAPAA